MFGTGQSGSGAPSGAGELLFSSGGGGSGHIRNDSSGSGGAPQAAGPGNFDLSNDFPSLGGGLAGALRQQQMLQAQQQQYRIATAGQGSINIAAEDFPALPGSGVGGGSAAVGSSAPGVVGGGSAPGAAPVQRGGTGGSNPASPFLGGRNSAGADGAVIGADGSNGPTSNGSNPLFNGLSGGIAGLSLGGGGSRPGNNPSSSSTGGGDVAPGSAINSEYGLLGLLGIIRMTDADRSALALGEDLVGLGLELKQDHKLLDKFGGPFTDKSAMKDYHYNIPMCFYMNPPALKTGHLAKFTLEILFYIFYAMPKDVLQAYAAQELYSKGWRYHADLKLWFKQAVVGDGLDLSDGTAKYIYFDYQSWARRHFSGNVQQIVGGFLSEEDVRVKLP